MVRVARACATFQGNFASESSCQKGGTDRAPSAPVTRNSSAVEIPHAVQSSKWRERSTSLRLRSLLNFRMMLSCTIIGFCSVGSADRVGLLSRPTWSFRGMSCRSCATMRSLVDRLFQVGRQAEGDGGGRGRRRVGMGEWRGGTPPETSLPLLLRPSYLVGVSL